MFIVCLVTIPCSPAVLKYVSVIYLHYILHSFSPEQFCIYVAVLLFLCLFGYNSQAKLFNQKTWVTSYVGYRWPVNHDNLHVLARTRVTTQVAANKFYHTEFYSIISFSFPERSKLIENYFQLLLFQLQYLNCQRCETLIINHQYEHNCPGLY